MVLGTLMPQGSRLVPRNTFEVCDGMSIQAAINAAAAQLPVPSATSPWTILMYPGIYDEGLITCAPWVNLKGVGPEGSVVIYANDAVPILLADNVEIDNFTVRLGTPSAARGFIQDNGVACTAKISNIVFEVTNPGAFNLYLLNSSGAGNYTIENCSCRIAGTGISASIRLIGAAATIHLTDNDFEFTNVNAIHIVSSGVNSVWTGRGNRWAGTCAMFEIAAAGTYTFDDDAMICTANWVDVISATLVLRHCSIEAPVIAGANAEVRLKNCSYRAIQTSSGALGNIIDESPQLRDYPWHVVKWGWMTALASADVGVRGTPVDAGSGQIMLEVTDNAPDFEAVEANTEVAGSLDNAFRPQRTPRFMKQISVNNFDAHATMFFGLRETLGNAVPGAAEHFMGFDWDGTNFRAINCNATGDVHTDLDTPDTDVQHQLEVLNIYGTRLEFYVDGIWVATHTTKMPTQPLDWQHLLATAGAGGGDVIQVTVRPGGVQECPN